MSTTPPFMPVTIPPVPAVAMDVLVLLQVPPVVELVSVIDEPAHTFAGPEIADGTAFMVSVADLAQPVRNV